MTNQGFDQHEDEQLSRVARSLHREWDTPDLWPRIAATLEEEERPSQVRLQQDTTRLKSDARRPRWQYPSSPVWRLAAAAAVLLTLGSVTWLAWPRVDTTTPPRDAAASDDRLLTDEAVAEIERAEAQ
jgi:hypothetical protein